MLNAIRTDLRLLLDCLKCQMKCPSSQKQALLTIVSICQQNSPNVEFLREIGGVTFIYSLSRASGYSEVKETALFTLSSLAEFNGSCKQSLCREEMFCGLADCMDQDASLTLKRVAVYTLCVLVSNNKQGQNLAMTSGCVQILLQLFRSIYPLTEGTDELLQLWTSVSSALCGCVNNPQNEENQRACMSVLPLVKVWLQQVSEVRTELAQPICSFVSMTVANNLFVQEYFASVGGLLTLSHTLSSAVSQCGENPAARVLATMVTRTLSACITNSEAIVSVLTQLTLVPDLLLLLSSPNLSPRDQLAAVLTLGRCTDACVEHQHQLVQGGGLPLMISLLTDANDEEVRKATTFVLQTCKALTGSVAGQTVESDLQRHRQEAWEMQQRIQQLERRQTLPEGRQELWTDSAVRKPNYRSRACEEEHEDVPQSFTPPTQPSPQTLPVLANLDPMQQHVRRQLVKDFEKSVNSFQKGNGDQQQPSDQQMRRERVMTNRGMEEMESDTTPNRERPTDELGHEKPDSVTYTKLPAQARTARGPDIFKHPAPMRRLQRAQFHSEDELSVCSELLDGEIERILITPASCKPRKLRCPGCVSGVDEVNSRSMGVVLRSCKTQCEFHQVLQRAEDRLKTSLGSKDDDHTHHSEIRDTSSSKTASKHTLKEEEGHINRRNRLINLTPLKRSDQTHGSDVETSYASNNKVHRDRKDYSGAELQYLSEGVRRFGHSWNTILWAYPFQQGRTNVDLAMKYRKLQQGSVRAPDLSTQDQ